MGLKARVKVGPHNKACHGGPQWGHVWAPLCLPRGCGNPAGGGAAPFKTQRSEEGRGKAERGEGKGKRGVQWDIGSRWAVSKGLIRGHKNSTRSEGFGKRLLRVDSCTVFNFEFFYGIFSITVNTSLYHKSNIIRIY